MDTTAGTAKLTATLEHTPGIVTADIQGAYLQAARGSRDPDPEEKEKKKKRREKKR